MTYNPENSNVLFSPTEREKNGIFNVYFDIEKVS